MKLPIKKKYFDMIKNGKKIGEYRDAHITFICETTGRKLKKDIINVEMLKRKQLPDSIRNMFDDEDIMLFQFKGDYICV